MPWGGARRGGKPCSPDSLVEMPGLLPILNDMTWSTFLYESACWPFQRYQRGVLAWVLAGVLTIYLVHTSLREGCGGYATCDFAGQWMHGRAFYREQMEQLYLVKQGEALLAEGFEGKELEKLIGDILKKGYRKDLYEEGIAGALYPPTASLLFSFFAQFTPSVAHAVAVVLYLAMCYGCGFFVSRITGHRLQWGEATLLILFFPNNFMGLMLGQNQVLTFFVLCAGWYCHHRRLPFVAGLVWGLFAYKPVFAVALLLVPLGLRSPRWFLGMALSGGLFVLATLPFTHGIDPWLRWVKVGQHAEQIYQTDRNWVWMSRDLVGLPRRAMWDPESMTQVLRYNIGVWNPGWMIYVTSTETGDVIFHPHVWLFFGDDFDWKLHQRTYTNPTWHYQQLSPEAQLAAKASDAPWFLTLIGVKAVWYEESPWYLTLIGYLLQAAVAGITILVCWRSIPRTVPLAASTIDGPPACFLLTGSLLCVFHFMHYDLLSFALPVLIALGQWSSWRWGRRSFFLLWYILWLTRTYAYFFRSAILEVPWDTLLLLLFWVWMGWITWRRSYVQPASLVAWDPEYEDESDDDTEQPYEIDQ